MHMIMPISDILNYNSQQNTIESNAKPFTSQANTTHLQHMRVYRIL